MIRRRRFLRAVQAAGVAAVFSPLVLAGCQSDEPSNDPEAERDAPTPTPKPDPDLPLLGRLVEAERELVQAYAKTFARHPDLKRPLQAYAKRHQQHEQALVQALRAAQPQGQRASASPSPTSTQSPSVPQAAAKAIGQLALAEQQAAKLHRADLQAVRSDELALLIASIRACESLHAEALDEMSREES